jgi:uncharacterized membrane protein
MKKQPSIVMLAVGIMILSSLVVFAADENFPPGGHGGRCAPDLLAQLPAEKEMLFHQTMRQVRESTADTRTRMRALHEEVNTILTAETFNEPLFREKTTAMQGLHAQMQQAMNNAVVTLAKQFTPAEREILAKLIPGMRGGHCGRGAHAKKGR